MKLSSLKEDFPASVVVFLVALPLCLGVALASGAPLLSGIISGIVGGIVVGFISGSHTSVSGPAAGLVSVVYAGIASLGNFEIFLVSVIIAGFLQIIAGIVKLGRIGDFIPNSVIKGMLAAIGLILISNQLSHAFGYDKTYEGSEDFIHENGESAFTEFFHALEHINLNAVCISAVSFLILYFFNPKRIKMQGLLKWMPATLMVVIVAVGLTQLFEHYIPNFTLLKEDFVQLPQINSQTDFNFPDFSKILDKKVLLLAVTIFLVASLETLLSIEATEKIDPENRISSPNRELIAQGTGNIIAGFLGGIPITAVIVRSSANIYAGAKSKFSTILHGGLLLFCVLVLPHIINLIPLSALAALLIATGLKLIPLSQFKKLYTQGWNQFIPFVVTISAILYFGLLEGIAAGIAVGLYFVFKENWLSALSVTKDNNNVLVKLKNNVSFLNKGALKEILSEIAPGSYVIIDGSGALKIDKDIAEIMDDFRANAESKEITIELKKSQNALNSYFKN